MDISIENDPGEQSSNSELVSCVDVQTNALTKGMNRSYLPIYGLNSRSNWTLPHWVETNLGESKLN